MSDAIHLEGVSHSYRQGWRRAPVLAVDAVSLTVSPGEAFGFIGTNGAGKSTTIKILTGVLRASAGQAFLFGKPVDRPEARRGVGYVPENPYLFDYLTPMEILRMSVELHGLKLGNIDAHCLGWLERFDLAHVAHRKIRQFSKGMTQRTALAQALAIQPRLLILDEPLSGLDPIGRRDTVEILAEYKKSGGALFITSHVLHDVERVADRYGLIRKGRLLTIQSPSDLIGGEQFVTIRSQGASPVPGFTREGGDRWVAEMPREDLWAAIDTLRASGHQLIEIRPALNLESAFVKFMGKGDSSPREGHREHESK